MQVSNDLVLGRTYMDKITGFTGVATGFVTYITGCDQVLLVPSVGDDGKRREGEWWDIVRIEPVESVADILLRADPAAAAMPAGADQTPGETPDLRG